MIREWTARRWTQEELDRLAECKVLSLRERYRLAREGKLTDLQRFAEESGRSIKSVHRKWDTLMRAPAREASR